MSEAGDNRKSDSVTPSRAEEPVAEADPYPVPDADPQDPPSPPLELASPGDEAPGSAWEPPGGVSAGDDASWKQPPQEPWQGPPPGAAPGTGFPHEHYPPHGGVHSPPQAGHPSNPWAAQGGHYHQGYGDPAAHSAASHYPPPHQVHGQWGGAPHGYPNTQLQHHHGQRDWTVALLLSVFAGSLGADRFYTGQIGLGILKLITLGGCGLWYVADILLIATDSYKDAEGQKLLKR